MAQLVEQLIRNQQVVGSSPISSFWADIYQVSAFFVMATRKMNASHLCNGDEIHERVHPVSVWYNSYNCRIFLLFFCNFPDMT